MNKNRNREVSSLAYFILKDVGICTRCQASWAEKGHALCNECLLYYRNHTKINKQIDRYNTKIVTMRVLKKASKNAS